MSDERDAFYAGDANTCNSKTHLSLQLLAN